MNTIGISLQYDLENNGITRSKKNDDGLEKTTAFGSILSGLEKMQEEYPDEFSKRLGDIQMGDYRGLMGTTISRIASQLESPSKIEDRNEPWYISDAENKELALKLGELKFGQILISDIKVLIGQLEGIDPYVLNKINNILLQEADIDQISALNVFFRNEGLGIDFMSTDGELELYYILLVLDKELDNRVFSGNTIHSLEDRIKIWTLKNKIST